MPGSHENLESAEDRVRLVNQAADRGDIDYLVGALRDREEDAQIAAALALQRSDNPDLLKPVAESIRDTEIDDLVRRELIFVLEGLGAASELTEILGSRAQGRVVREEAAIALGRMTSTDGRKLWRQARSNDPSWWRRAFDR